MAITDIKLGGKVFTDAGTPVNGATVTLLETGTSAEEAATTTNSSGEWSFTETSLDTTYDIKIAVGNSKRYILWSDEITVTGIDAASMKIRGTEGAVAPLYFFADQADDAGDAWRMQASASNTLAIGSDKASAGTIIDYLTITNGANAAASTVTVGGILTVTTTLDVNGTADFDVTDFDIASSGDIDLLSTYDAAAAIYLRENAGTSGTIKIHADQGTSVTEGAESINILSDAGGVGIRSTANLAKAVNITSDGGTTGSIAIFNDQGTSVTEGAESISLLSDAGGIGIRSTANLANAVNLTVDGGTSSTMTLFNDQGTAATEGAASIQLLSDVGGINIKSGLNGANALLLTADGGTSETIVLHADQGTGTGSIELLSDAGGIELDAGTDIILDAGGADIFLKDDGTLFGTLNNNSGELLIKSSSSGTTAATFSGANVTFAGTVDATTDFTVGSTVITDSVITLTPSSSDTVTMTAATNGAFSLVTVDAAGTDANIQITADGTFEVDATSMTLDASSDIVFDAGGADFRFNVDTTNICTMTKNGNADFVIATAVQDKDLIINGNDGGSTITALTLDMSAAGAATFNDKVIATELDISGDIDIDGTSNLDAVDIDGTLNVAGATVFQTSIDITGSSGIILENDETITNSTNGYIALSGGLTLPNDGTIGSAGDADSIAISSAGVVTMNQIPVFSAGINVSGGTIAGTLATAAQGNVTSLGTLTALTGGTGDLVWDTPTLCVDSSTNRVGIGIAAPTVKLQVVGGDEQIFADSQIVNTAGNTASGGNADESAISIYAGSASNSPAITYSGNDGLRFYQNGTNAGNKMTISRVGAVNIVGALTAASYADNSDRRVKTNIQTLSSALDKISQLRGVSFDYLWGNKESQIGLIAQEMESIIPEVVSVNTQPLVINEGTSDEEKITEVKTISYGNLVAYLVEAIKELKTEIDVLKS